MKDRLIFDLLGRLAEEHENRRLAAEEPNLSVVPVLVDDMSQIATLLTAFGQHLGGILLDLTSPRFHSAIEARTDDPELRAFLETSFELARSNATNRIGINLEGGEVDATLFRDNEAQVATGGWGTILALARALFAVELDASDAAIVAYRETELDRPLRGKTLQSLCALPEQGISLGRIRTLIVVIEAPQIDIADHCRPGQGIVHALLLDGAQHRRPLSQLPNSVQRFTQPRDKPIVLFLGAGFSASSHLPMGNRLRDQSIARICSIDGEAYSSDDLAGVFYSFADDQDLLLPTERELGHEAFVKRLTLEHVVRIESEYFRQAIPQTIEDFAAVHDRVLQRGTIGEAVVALRRLIARRARLILITVNFDELLEQPNDDLDIAVSADDFEQLTPKLKALVEGEDVADDRIPYLKLHGSISDRPSCVASDRQTLTGLNAKKRLALETIVQSGGDRLLWVYVGASMRDLDLRPVFEMREFHDRVEEYWASPYIEPSVRTFAELRQHSWPSNRRLATRMVTEIADVFVAKLDEMWPEP